MSGQLIITLHRGTSWISKAIRWQSRSEYSHAGIILPDGMFIEAREGIGVRALPRLVGTKGEAVDLFIVEATAMQVAAIADFVRGQLGKKYDWTMVLRFLSRRQESRSTTGKWFCSELVFAAFDQAGIRLLRDTQPWEVSPGLLARSPLLSPHRLNVQPAPIDE